MENNIIDLIQNNTFVKRMYPNGFANFFVGNIILCIDGSITINIHTTDKPAIEVSKWGKWSENYNVVVIELSAHTTVHCDIENWQTVSNLPYKLDINKVEDQNYSLKFSNAKTKVCIETDWLLFQQCSTYIL